MRNTVGMKGCKPFTNVEMTRPGEYFVNKINLYYFII